MPARPEQQVRPLAVWTRSGEAAAVVTGLLTVAVSLAGAPAPLGRSCEWPTGTDPSCRLLCVRGRAQVCLSPGLRQATGDAPTSECSQRLPGS